MKNTEKKNGKSIVETLNNAKNKTLNAMVDGTSAVLGAGHFVADSIATGCMEAEAYLKKKRYGEDPETIKCERMFKTLERREAIKDAAKSTMDKLRSMKDTISRKKTEGKPSETKLIVIKTA